MDGDKKLMFECMVQLGVVVLQASRLYTPNTPVHPDIQTKGRLAFALDGDTARVPPFHSRFALLFLQSTETVPGSSNPKCHSLYILPKRSTVLRGGCLHIDDGAVAVVLHGALAWYTDENLVTPGRGV